VLTVGGGEYDERAGTFCPLCGGPAANQELGGWECDLATMGPLGGEGLSFELDESRLLTKEPQP
jgi:hypothetical protein